jgi:hypothetical protein
MFLVAASMILAAGTGSSAQGIKGREILGLRIGGVLTTGNFKEDFGSGTELEIYFIEGLGSWYGISISFSSHNLGESKDREKNIEFTGLDRKVDLNIYSVTVAFHALTTVRERFVPNAEAGIGLYTITASIPAGLFEGHVSDNQPGLYGGAGILLRLAKGLFLNFSGKYHYVFSGGNDSHTIYFYTGEKRTHIFQISGGITLFTG